MIDRRSILAVLAGAGLASVARATEPPIHPPALPKALSLWTNPELAAKLSAPLRDFERASGVRVTLVAKGSDIAMAALYTGRADAVLIGRKATDSERQAFEWVRQYPVAEVALGANGPVGCPAPIAIMVNRANPIATLSMAQLRDLLLLPKPLFWRDFGVKGAVAGSPIVVAMPDGSDGTGHFLREVLADGRAQLMWDRIREYPGGDPRTIVRSVAQNASMIGFGALATSAVSTVAIAGHPRSDDAGYPLARRSYLYLERPLADVRPAVRALADFLRPLPS